MVGKKFIDGLIHHHPYKKILIIVDRKDWCYFRIASQVKRYLSNKYNFTIIDELEFIQNKHQIVKDYDLYIFIGWTLFRTALDTNIDKNKVICGIYDELSWITYKDIFDKINDIYAFYVSSNKLYNLISKIKKEKVYICEDGVDTSFFSYMNKSSQTKFTIGWSGNSQWGNWFNDKSHKGLEDIKEAYNFLKYQNINLIVCDRNEKWRTLEEMKTDLYSKINLYICASKCEGTPNPVLESLSCGLPVITTNVGIVSQINYKNGITIWDREKEGISGLVNYIQEVRNNYSYLDRKSIRKYMIKNWDWSIKVKNFEVMINNFFNKK